MPARIGTAVAAGAGLILLFLIYKDMLGLIWTSYDFRIFYAAARALQHGANPYDIHQVFRQEQILYPALLSGTEQRELIQQNPYVQGPVLLVALLPALRWTPTAVYPVWFAGLAAMTALSLVVLAHLWPVPRPRARALWLFLSPIAFLGPFFGQVDALLLLSLVLALRFVGRGHHGYAGTVLTLGLIKPQIMAGPLLLCALMAWRHGRLPSYLTGAFAGTLVTLALGTLVSMPALPLLWLAGLGHFSRGAVYAQPDLSSLTTLYINWLPHRWDTALATTILVVWACAQTYLWQRTRTRHDEMWCLMLGLVGWLLATPYAHPHDDILTLPAVWFLYTHRPTPALRAMSQRALTPLFVLSWWLLPAAGLLGLARHIPLPMRGYGIVPVLLLAVLLWQRRTISLSPRRRHPPSTKIRWARTTHRAPRQADELARAIATNRLL